MEIFSFTFPFPCRIKLHGFFSVLAAQPVRIRVCAFLSLYFFSSTLQSIFAIVTPFLYSCTFVPFTFISLRSSLHVCRLSTFCCFLRYGPASSFHLQFFHQLPFLSLLLAVGIPEFLSCFLLIQEFQIDHQGRGPFRNLCDNDLGIFPAEVKCVFLRQEPFCSKCCQDFIIPEKFMVFTPLRSSRDPDEFRSIAEL